MGAERNSEQQLPDDELNQFSGLNSANSKSQLPQHGIPTYLEYPKVPSDLPERRHSHGITGLGPPPELEDYLDSISLEGTLKEWYIGNNDYEEVDISDAIGFTKERYGISEAGVFLDPGGSDALLERYIWTISENSVYTRLLVMGPCFPNLINFAERLNPRIKEEGVDKRQRSTEKRVVYGPLDGFEDVSLYQTMSERIDNCVRKIGSLTRKSRYANVIYVNDPNSPTGDVLTLEDKRKLAKAASEKGARILFDEALGDFLPDDQSAIQLTEEFEGITVLRTTSKGLGMPRVKTGIEVSSPGEETERHISSRRPLMNAEEKLHIANVVLDPKIIEPYLKMVREIIGERKEAYLAAFKAYGIKTLPTSPFTPICTIDGEADDFHNNALENSLVLARGSTFVKTHPLMSDRYDRFTVGPVDDAEMVAYTIKASIEASKKYEETDKSPRLGKYRSQRLQG